MKALFLIMSITFLGLCSAQDHTFYSDHERGWFWHESAPKNEPEKKEKISPQTPAQILKNQGQDWEESVARAVLEPNNKNIKEYVEKTEKITSQAQKFSSAFERFIWANPEFDYSLQNPTSTEAIIAKNKDERLSSDLAIKKIAQSHALLFFFSSSCSVCHSFAPILKKFEKDYSFSVLAISNDGAGLKEYPKFERNFKLAQSVNLEVTPSVYLLNPDSNAVIPISFGFSDYEALRVKLLSAFMQVKK